MRQRRQKKKFALFCLWVSQPPPPPHTSGPACALCPQSDTPVEVTSPKVCVPTVPRGRSPEITLQKLPDPDLDADNSQSLNVVLSVSGPGGSPVYEESWSSTSTDSLSIAALGVKNRSYRSRSVGNTRGSVVAGMRAASASPGGRRHSSVLSDPSVAGSSGSDKSAPGTVSPMRSHFETVKPRIDAHMTGYKPKGGNVKIPKQKCASGARGLGVREAQGVRGTKPWGQ